MTVFRVLSSKKAHVISRQLETVSAGSGSLQNAHLLVNYMNNIALDNAPIALLASEINVDAKQLMGKKPTVTGKVADVHALIASLRSIELSSSSTAAASASRLSVVQASSSRTSHGTTNFGTQPVQSTVSSATAIGGDPNSPRCTYDGNVHAKDVRCGRQAADEKVDLFRDNVLQIGAHANGTSWTEAEHIALRAQFNKQRADGGRPGGNATVSSVKTSVSAVYQVFDSGAEVHTDQFALPNEVFPCSRQIESVSGSVTRTNVAAHLPKTLQGRQEEGIVGTGPMLNIMKKNSVISPKLKNLISTGIAARDNDLMMIMAADKSRENGLRYTVHKTVPLDTLPPVLLDVPVINNVPVATEVAPSQVCPPKSTTTAARVFSATGQPPVEPVQSWGRRCSGIGPAKILAKLKRAGIKTSGSFKRSTNSSQSLPNRHRLRRKRIKTTSPHKNRFTIPGTAFACDFACKFLPSHSGHIWLLLFRDQVTNELFAYGCKRRSDFLQRLKSFTNDHPKMNFLYSDNESTFLTPAVKKHLATGCREHVTHKQRPPGLKQARYAGKIEGAFGVLLPVCYTDLFDANLSSRFWLLCIINGCRTWNIVNSKHKADDAKMRTLVKFGSVAFWHDSERKSQRKFHKNNKARSPVSRGIYVGFNDDNSCFRIWCPRTHRIIETDSAEFDEDAIFYPRGHKFGHSQWHEAFDIKNAPTLDKFNGLERELDSFFDDDIKFDAELSDDSTNISDTDVSGNDLSVPFDANVDSSSSDDSDVGEEPAPAPITISSEPDFLLDDTTSSSDDRQNHSDSDTDNSELALTPPNGKYFDITSRVSAVDSKPSVQGPVSSRHTPRKFNHKSDTFLARKASRMKAEADASRARSEAKLLAAEVAQSMSEAEGKPKSQAPSPTNDSSPATASLPTAPEGHDDYRDYDNLKLFHQNPTYHHAFSTRSRTSDDDLFNSRTDYRDDDNQAPADGQFRAVELAPDEFCMHNDELDEYIDFDSNVVFHINDVTGPPVTLEEALLRPDSKEWRASYDAELASCRERGTWVVRKWRDIPAGRRAIRCKLVFKRKMIGDKLDKYKCRIVAKGFSQVRGLDFFETWAPTVRDETVKISMAHAAARDLEVQQFDVSTAFLYPTLDEQIFMRMPEGLPTVDSDGDSLVLELKKCLYGLKQSANAWFGMLTTHITTKMGYTQSESDPCLFFKDVDGDRYLLLTFVDDILIIGKKLSVISIDEAQLADRFKITSLGQIAWFLQMEVTRDREARTITLSNRHKVIALLDHHQMADCKPVSTPMVDGKARLRAFDLAELEPGADMSFQQFPYREVVDGLL